MTLSTFASSSVQALFSFSKEDLEKIVSEKVTAQVERALSDGGMHDRRWKGNDYHLSLRKRANELIDRDRAICYDTVDVDPFFEGTHIYTSGQWDREVRQCFMRNHPRADGDPSEFFQFTVRPDGGRKWVTRLSMLHCAMERAIAHTRMKRDARPQALRRLRERLATFPGIEPYLNPETCEGCMKDLERMAQ